MEEDGERLACMSFIQEQIFFPIVAVPYLAASKLPLMLTSLTECQISVQYDK